jgi:hypothetical protein
MEKLAIKRLNSCLSEKYYSTALNLVVCLLTPNHVQYAGNLIVYGAWHPADGDWFGGLNASNAEEFLEAFASMEASCLQVYYCSLCVVRFVPFVFASSFYFFNNTKVFLLQVGENGGAANQALRK